MKTVSKKQRELAKSLGLSVSARAGARWVSQQIDKALAERKQQENDLYEEANQASLIDLAGRYTTLHKSGYTCTAPCPMPSCKSTRDGFWVDSRTNTGGCHSCDWVWNGSGSGPVGFLRAREGLEAWEARDMILGRSSSPIITTTIKKAPKQPKRKKESGMWKNPAWQESARAQAELANMNLFAHPDAQPARDYLLSRGINPGTWEAFMLGADLNPDGKRIGPVVTIPWLLSDYRVTNIRYRLLTPIKRKKGYQKYDSRPNGDALIFGGHLRRRTNTLILCEGELNAMSIWQAAEDAYFSLDVLSYGARRINSQVIDQLRKVANSYNNVAIIADNQADAQRNAEQLQLNKPCMIIANPSGKDPNELLQEGTLLDLIQEILKPTPTDLTTAKDELFTLCANLIGHLDDLSLWRQMETAYDGNATTMYNFYKQMVEAIGVTQMKLEM